jgi:hypothetical protein
MSKFCLVIALLFVVSTSVNAQVVINEVSPVSNPEWVELYNTSSASASLKEHSIDFGSDSQKKSFCDNEQIGPNSYKLIILTSSWLNNAGDSVSLRRGDDLVDTVTYGSASLPKPSSETESVSRSPEGSPNWIKVSQQSKQGEVISFDCPTPTPSVSPSPSPTPSPSPSPTPPPTPTPLASPVKPSPTSRPSISPSPSLLGEVSGVSDAQIDLSGFGVSPPASPKSLEVGGSPSKPALNRARAKTAIIIGVGLILLAVAGYFGYRKYKSLYNHEE